MRRTLTWAGLCLAASAILGCQGSTAPTAPPSNAPSAAHMPVATPEQGWVGVAAVDLVIDAEAMEATVTPVRLGSAIGDTYSELGLAPGFTELFGRHLQVAALRMAGPNTVEVDLAVDHPFSAATRPDLAIFNLKCYVVTDAAQAVTVDGEGLAPGILGNADGYGQMWSLTADSLPTFTPASLQPYVILREDPTAGTFNFQSPAGYNVFFPGQTSVDTLSLNIGTSSSLSARLYLTADYGQSAVRATRQTPAYELPKFAGNAPWKVQITEIANDLEGGVASSTATYQVDVWDWKHGQSLGSDVAAGTLEVPGVTSTPLNLSFTGTGTDPTPLTASTLVTNSLAAAGGTYWVIAKITDSATGIGLKEDLQTPVNFSSYVTYQVIPVEVDSTPVNPPTAVIAIGNCDPSNIRQGLDASLDGSGSIPGDTAISTYEWDYDYDGITFDVDGTGVSTLRPCPTAGTFDIALRVTAVDLATDIATISITVNGTAPAWTTPVRLTNDTFSQIFDSEGDDPLVVAPDGTVHLLYLATSGSLKRIERVELPPCAGSTWSAPELVVDPGTGVSNLMPATTIDDDGDLHLAYISTGNNWRHMERSAGVWGPSTLITGPAAAGGSYRTACKLTTNVDGRLGLLLVEHPNFLSFCPGLPAPPSPLMVYEYNGTAWSAGVQAAAADCNYIISGSCGSTTFTNESADLVSLNSGDWLVAFEDLVNPYINANTTNTGQVGWNRQTAGVWGTAANIYTPAAGASDQVRLARGPDGVIWLAFRRNSGEVQMAQYNGTVWDPTYTQVVPMTSSYPRIFLTIDALGQGVVGSNVDSATVEFRLKQFAHTDPLGAIAAAPYMQPQPNQAWARGYGMAIAKPDGTMAAAWRSAQWGTGAASEMEGNAWE